MTSELILMSNTELAELCEGMADVIEARGHCQGKYEETDGSVCLVGSALAYYQENQSSDGLSTVHKTVAVALDTKDPVTLNDGRKQVIEEYVQIPVFTLLPLNFMSDQDADVMISSMGYTEEIQTRYVETPGLTKDEAVELCTQRAKFWRNQP